MKTDIQIAQEATMLPIKDVAATIGIKEDDLELYGKYKAKISDELINRTKKNPDGKLILVTAINPTPAGEGKTTTSVGLGEAFGRLGKKALIALREPDVYKRPLKFQGIWDREWVQGVSGLTENLFTPDKLEFKKDANMLKGGLVYADYITTVSDTYANEIQTEYYGEGLNGLLIARHFDMQGIVNGIDYLSLIHI